MAILKQAVTLRDIALRQDPNGAFADIIELLRETNEILDDMVFMEANNFTSHLTTVRTGLPSGTWRRLNFGVQPEQSETAQRTETIGMLESYAEVDKKLVELSGNPAAFRLSEDAAFLQGMTHTMAETLFYGDIDVNPDRFHGLSARYSYLDTDDTQIGSHVINGGGVGADNTSIWLLVWGDRTMFGIYPKGSRAGFSSENLGQVTLTDANGGLYEGYRTHYSWDMGLCVRDWRYGVRIANIDVSDLKADASSGADLVDLLIQASELVEDTTSGRAVFYMNRTVRSYLRRQMLHANGIQVTFDEVAGKKVMQFDDIPVRRCDALLKTEAAVTA